MLQHPIRSAPTRRGFLGDVGMGFAGLALGAMLHRDGIVRGDELPGSPHLAPKAKHVIWIFLAGGVSHVEGFDPKPALTKYAGMTIAETPYKDVLTSPFNANQRIHVPNDANGQPRMRIYPPQVGSTKRGKSGIEVSDWWPEVGSCVDDLAVIRSVWTTDNNHGAQLQFHTGRHVLEGRLPTIGSWIHYGLGSLNDDLPSFVVLGPPIGDCCGGVGGHGAGYLGPEHDGVRLEIDPARALPYASPVKGVWREEQRGEFALMDRLNRISAEKYPEDPALQGANQVVRAGLPDADGRPRGGPPGGRIRRDAPALRHRRRCLAGFRAAMPRGQEAGRARRPVRPALPRHRRGRRLGRPREPQGEPLEALRQVDRPIAGLLQRPEAEGPARRDDRRLGQRVRPDPRRQNAGGRDHHAFGFPVWMAGGGIKGGIVHGSTDELGFHAVVDRHYVTDIHATVLKQLGLDARRLEIPSHKRLEMDFGKPIDAILA